jgi:glycosyltransferase involved in cell wall biosynthesis
MRILRCIHSLNPRIGGPGEGIRQVSSVLQKQGHNIDVVCLDDPESSWLEEESFSVHALGPVANAYGYTKKLIPWFQSNYSHYDCVIVHGLWQYTSFGAWRALRKTNLPYYVYPHGMLDPWFKKTYPLKHLKKCLYWPWAEYRVLKDARAVLFTCDEERILARQSFKPYRCREEVVHYGTALPAGNAEKQMNIFFKKYPQLKGKRILLYLGRIHEKKGIDILIQAFAQLKSDNDIPVANDIHLVIAGPCADQNYLQSLKNQALNFEPKIADHIIWTGMLKDDFKWGAYHSADAFILPSHQENFGIAVVEALATGTPVLISDKINIWREIYELNAGFIEKDTLTGCEKLLSRWLAAEASEMIDISKNARLCFLEKFEVIHAAESLMSILNENK